MCVFNTEERYTWLVEPEKLKGNTGEHYLLVRPIVGPGIKSIEANLSITSINTACQFWNATTLDWNSHGCRVSAVINEFWLLSVTFSPNFNDSKGFFFCLRLVLTPQIQSPSASATTSLSLGALFLSLPTWSTPHALLSCLQLLLRILWLSASWGHSLWSISW